MSKEVGHASYKAVENIYKTLLYILIIINLTCVLLFYFINANIAIFYAMSVIVFVLMRLNFNIKHSMLISVLFHANTIIGATLGSMVLGWASGMWIMLACTILVNYFLAFDSKRITYAIVIMELLILIALYFFTKDINIGLSKEILLITNTANIILIFYTRIKLSTYADIITAADYQRLKNETDEFEKLSKRDFLTGLLNRRSIKNILRYELSALKENENPNSNLVVMLGDIDNFKTINDTFGHERGDAVLKDVADMLVSIFRKDDYICRWGGEEFLIILPNTKTDFLYKITARLTRSINSIKLPDKSAVSMTFGMVVCTNKTIITMDELIGKADALLYQGKRNGKNRIEWKFD
ncbi:GGDEF domain-containing protein [Campylobacter sp. RM13119]|uniref:GGDEF domain-containing protein n=1 Tax=Campylobacter TaxID=194 RepID=UPI0014760EAF|nr:MULTISPECIES: GGDEF domain-containing protein [unclassified Campylobacter]MBE3606781.1 GGDEF domain-containing protein [Campylobacter sp. RM13119]MBE3610376.1 GGDEF domain-containing protein [Campylobacter sp. RM12916]